MPGEIKFSKSTLNWTRVTENFHKLGQGNLWDNAKVSRTTFRLFSVAEHYRLWKKEFGLPSKAIKNS